MRKICSLDFIQIAQLPTDVLDSYGNVVLQANTSPDEQWILKNYFKDLYTEEVKIIIQKPESVENKVVLDEKSVGACDDVTGAITDDLSNDQADDDNLVVEEETLDTNLKAFSEEKIAKISEVAFELASMFGYDNSEKEKLKLIATYFNASLNQFTKKDLLDKKFSANKANKSYEMLNTKAGIPDDVKLALKNIIEPYDTVKFNLSNKIPLNHIMTPIYVYEDLMLKFNNNKDKVLEKMLQYGGNRFNIFVLHKFLKIMRDMND